MATAASQRGRPAIVARSNVAGNISVRVDSVHRSSTASETADPEYMHTRFSGMDTSASTARPDR